MSDRRAVFLCLVVCLVACGPAPQASFVAEFAPVVVRPPDEPIAPPQCPPVEGPVTVELTLPQAEVVGEAPALTHEVELPAGCWAKAELRLAVTARCSGAREPNGNWPRDCDPFDRLAHVALERDGEPSLMLLSAVTPFGGDAEWVEDVTGYTALFEGRRRFTVRVSTSTDSSGAATGTRAGWGVAARLVLTPSATKPSRASARALAFVPRLSPGAAAPRATLEAPAGAQVTLDAFVTGHGAVGAGVCDEFCSRTLIWSVGSQAVRQEPVWRSCADNCVRGPGRVSCGGRTYDYTCTNSPTGCPPSVTFDRAGWCPGQQVERRSVTFVAPGGPIDVSAALDTVTGYFSVALAAVVKEAPP